MDAKQRQLEAALQQHGWRVVDRRDKDLGWWADSVWVVESDWSPRGKRIYMTFLVDPMWEGPRRPGEGVWAMSVSPTVPRSREEGRQIALKRWDDQIQTFIAEMATFRTGT
jgi:hypothetical protein